MKSERVQRRQIDFFNMNEYIQYWLDFQTIDHLN